jgi:hypothetical protein
MWKGVTKLSEEYIASIFMAEVCVTTPRQRPEDHNPHYRMNSTNETVEDSCVSGDKCEVYVAAEIKYFYFQFLQQLLDYLVNRKMFRDTSVTIRLLFTRNINTVWLLVHILIKQSFKSFWTLDYCSKIST